MYSLLAACKNAGADPRKWLTDTLTQLPIRLRENLNMDDLVPSQWIKSHPEAVVNEE